MQYNIEEVEKEYYPQYKYSEVERELHPCPPEIGLDKEAYFKLLPPAKKTIIRDFLDLGGDKQALHIVQKKHSDKYQPSTIYDIVTTYKLFLKKQPKKTMSMEHENLKKELKNSTTVELLIKTDILLEVKLEKEGMSLEYLLIQELSNRLQNLLTKDCL